MIINQHARARTHNLSLSFLIPVGIILSILIGERYADTEHRRKCSCIPTLLTAMFLYQCVKNTYTQTGARPLPAKALSHPSSLKYQQLSLPPSLFLPRSRLSVRLCYKVIYASHGVCGNHQVELISDLPSAVQY